MILLSKVPLAVNQILLWLRWCVGSSHRLSTGLSYGKGNIPTDSEKHTVLVIKHPRYSLQAALEPTGLRTSQGPLEQRPVLIKDVWQQAKQQGETSEIWGVRCELENRKGGRKSRSLSFLLSLPPSSLFFLRGNCVSTQKMVSGYNRRSRCAVTATAFHDLASVTTSSIT